ncbi:MAG: hypothetical protein JWR22_1551 [Herminiimonas sp.]|nr:hypothetical protein [Herminiimonas sp.]
MPRQPATPASRRKYAEWLLLFVALTLLGACITYAHFTEADRVNTTERDRLQVLVKVISNDIESDLITTNLALEGVIADYLRPSAVSSSKDISRRLHTLGVAVPSVRAWLVLDAKGVVTAASIPRLIGTNLSQRDYFKTVHEKTDRTTLYVSAPFQSLKKEKDLIITAARMVPGASGEFNGLVVATLTQDFFRGLFGPVVYAPDVRVFVAHGDGRQLLNYPQKTGIDGVDLSNPNSFFSRHRRSGQVDSVLSGTVYTTGEKRLMDLHTLQPASLGMDKALVIGLSRNLDAIEQPLQSRAVTNGLIYAALTLLCCVGLYRMQTRRAKAEALRVGLERERREADERMQLALRGADLGLWSVHVATKTGSFSEHSFAMLGFAPQNMLVDPEFWHRRVHPEDKSAYNAMWSACVDGSVPLYDLAYRIEHRDGHWVWILGRAQATERDERGEAISITGTHMDITVVKTAEQEVVRGRNELQAIFSNLSEAVFVFDRDHRIVRANRARQGMQGILEPQTMWQDGMTNIELILPSGEVLPQEQWPSWRGLRGDFVRDFEVEIRTKDTGNSFLVEFNTAPILDASGKLDLLILTFKNVTERRLTFALRESESRFRTLIEDAPLAIAILRGGYFVYANARYNILHGYLPEDDLKGLPWNAMISAASRAVLHAQEALIVEDSPIEQMFEAQGLAKGGILVPVFKTTARVDLIDGPATLIFAQDISAQKHAETIMLQALDSAEAANRSKAEFLANMSHEIRSPLNSILGLAYLLEQAPLGLDAHNMVRKIRASGRSLLGIINDILDVSKIEAGHMMIEEAPFRLEDVIDNVADTMGIGIVDKNIQVVIQSIPAGIDNVLGDALRLEQVLINLTSNAIKFTHVGRVELRIDLLSQIEDKLMLRFAVKDTGIGIPLALQTEVFSAFTQADTSTTRRFGGSGLGLTICRQLVTLMGGVIGLTSTPGEGSEFWFTVPLRQSADADFSSPDMMQVDALIADDCEFALKAMGDIAQRLGWQVNVVGSGEAALSLVLARKGGKLPDVIVLDWKMQGMDGLATAIAIRESVPKDSCPIVIMATAFSLGTLAGQPGADMVDAVLSKPVTASSLYNAVLEAQGKRASAGMPQALSQAAGLGLEGVRVLVVDDSEINRDVAERILNEQGATVTLAVDGKAALNWLLAHPNDVDLVLMDVQMPVMDGIEATRQLRLIPQFNDLPIVALTAGAFKSQQDAAHAAGMTHFVSKPFDVPTTIALIQRLRRRPTTIFAGDARPTGITVSVPTDLGPPIDASVLDVAQGLRIWSDMQTYRDYLRRFADGYGNTVELMKASLAADDRPAAAALAHKLLGVSGNMALPDVYRLAGEADTALAREHDPTRALARLGDALEKAIAAIKQVASQVAADDLPFSPELAVDDLPSVTRERISTLLSGVLEALDTDNPGPVAPFLAALEKLLPQRELASIRESVHSFDFRRAEADTRQLATRLRITLAGNRQ